MERNTEHRKIGVGREGVLFGDTAPEKLVSYLTRSGGVQLTLCGGNRPGNSLLWAQLKDEIR